MRLLPRVAAVTAFGAIGVGLIFLFAGGADHAPGPGEFSKWTGAKDKFLHVYLWVEESAGCPSAIRVVPTDEAAEIWKKFGKQPKRIVWKIRDKQAGDEWVIETKPGTDDHLPGIKAIPAGPDDAYWSLKPKPVGKPTIKKAKKEAWHWLYNVTVKRPGCPDTLLDPPIYIRR